MQNTLEFCARSSHITSSKKIWGGPIEVPLSQEVSLNTVCYLPCAPKFRVSTYFEASLFGSGYRHSLTAIRGILKIDRIVNNQCNSRMFSHFLFVWHETITLRSFKKSRFHRREGSETLLLRWSVEMRRFWNASVEMICTGNNSILDSLRHELIGKSCPTVFTNQMCDH